VTDRVAEEQREEDPVTYQAGEPLIFSSYTRPSTGLIYMQARYYEPETGRFYAVGPAAVWLRIAAHRAEQSVDVLCE